MEARARSLRETMARGDGCYLEEELKDGRDGAMRPKVSQIGASRRHHRE